MHFNFTSEQDNFRADVRSFLHDTLTPSFWDYQREHRLPGWSPEFSRAAAERGWLAISWPEEYGGRQKGPMVQTIYMEEMAYAGAPQEHHRRAVQQVGPSIMLFGNDEQKARFLPKIASGTISFAMGLSEPNAGSDLANVETTAIRDGDDYILNGVKRYTSGAHYSDYLWTVARTDPNAPKHRGISMIAVPLDAPGVEVEPLLDLQSDHHFNYIYLRDVRVPAGNLVGEENRGWYVNAQTMDYERSGGAHIGSSRRLVDRATRWLRQNPQYHPTLVQKLRLADIATTNEVAWLLGYRVAWLREQGLFPNHEASMVKLLTSSIRQDVPRLMVEIMGPAGLMTSGAHDEGWGSDYLDSASATVGQGTSEIQRNVIATRGLGLPRG